MRTIRIQRPVLQNIAKSKEMLVKVKGNAANTLGKLLAKNNHGPRRDLVLKRLAPEAVQGAHF